MGRNFSVVLLASAARTAAPAVPSFRNRRHAGMQLVLSVTAASGTGGLTLSIQAASRAGAALGALLEDGTAIKDTGTYIFRLAPNEAGADDVRVAESARLPLDWLVQIAHGDGSSYTYSLTATLLPE